MLTMNTPPAHSPSCLLQLGADEVVDYTQQRFEEELKDRPVNAVLDTIVHGSRPHEYQHRRCAARVRSPPLR
jgi:D-arabinose 1-dehydrogenase-like Zn-dependent alcohol dehydrogenase